MITIEQRIKAAEFQVKELSEYKRQLFDQDDAMAEHGIKSSDQRRDTVYRLIMDVSNAIYYWLATIHDYQHIE